ncbi:hypothetical protein MSG28_013517 [Choristoneura fumiferana]|uniref:Uncharacterized protein n=1 Tax=Choristoneura fumiferana TaxID=7141 RepID=A0ACC0K8D9_CHOFU|nr:hypothetical protein MSG28_013517 [Choristoneura fumiferana]
MLQTASINEVNPIIDRIMEDESVEVVVMANTEGLPILTNVNVLGATNYATAIHRLSTMVQNIIKEMDPFDEALVFRMKTSKAEVMTAPHKEFSIIIVQQARQKKNMKKKRKQRANKSMET